VSGEVKTVSELVSRLKELSTDAEASEADLAAAFRSDVPRLLELLDKAMEVGEKAQEMLVKAYSLPDDGGHGIRIQSEDAVKLQWALRAIGIGDDAGESGFKV